MYLSGARLSWYSVNWKGVRVRSGVVSGGSVDRLLEVVWCAVLARIDSGVV